MVLRVYNTLSRRKEVFEPLAKYRVKMFVCGPTVYDYSHLGHARTYIGYDIIAKYLRFKGYSLFYIMNITDIDDKIIDRAREEKRDPLDLAREFEKYFHEDMRCLGIDSVNLYARASEHIDELIKQIQILLDKGFAYITENGIYYDVTKFEDYGKLSNQRSEELIIHRIELDPTKRNPGDFSLWKAYKPHEPYWESPWGRGRPGWHIEDTAITLTYFGNQYDIHGGAVELIFPHHEAEIAQAEATTGVKPFVKYWIHTGILYIDGKKMSKSLGNFITVREALRKYRKEELRFFMASTLYRSPIDFKEEKLEQSRRSLETLKNSIFNFESLDEVEDLREEDEALKKRFKDAEKKIIEAMDDDFNTPIALSHIFEFSKELNRFSNERGKINRDVKKEILEGFRNLLSIFGIEEQKKKLEEDSLNKIIEEIIQIRQELRARRDYELADRIRARLKDLGIILEDTGKGVKWRFKS
ncbi:MAG: cysteine--tRNA ligase [Nitrososphaerales archaeon]